MNGRRALLFALAVALLLAGCGGGGGSTDSTGGGSVETVTGPDVPPSKAEFVKRGNEICSGINKAIAARVQDFADKNELSADSGASKEQAEELITEIVVPALSKQIEEFREIGAPDALAKEVDSYLKTSEEAVELAEDDPSKLTSPTSESPFVRVSREAAALGLQACVTGI